MIEKQSNNQNNNNKTETIAQSERQRRRRWTTSLLGSIETRRVTDASSLLMCGDDFLLID